MARSPISLVIAIAGIILTLGGGLCLAADPENGKALVAEKCTRCHGSEVYTRPDRRVGSLEALSKQVEVCSASADTGWNDRQKADVVAYLNQEFYKFK